MGENDIFLNLLGQLGSMRLKGSCGKISKSKDLRKRAKMQNEEVEG